MTFPTAFLEELRRRVPVSWAAGRRLKLIRAGRGEYKALCPFHREKTPSFHVVDDKAMFHCFGCGEHGDVISLVMHMDGLDFREAVKMLAGHAGLTLPDETPEERERYQRQATLGSALDAAVEFYRNQLLRETTDGAEALSYLLGRGFTRHDLDVWSIGYAPPGDALLRELRGQFPVSLLKEAGLVGEWDDRIGDVFHRRIMFPIADEQGRWIGFSGRAIRADDQPKYKNTPETPLFHKGRILYGYHLARTSARKGARLIVVEGQPDVIACHRAGLFGAVAPLGTALTEHQIELLWRASPEPVLCFDGDAAGLKAADRAAERIFPVLRAGRQVRVAFMPPGHDPDSALAADPRAMENALDDAVSLDEAVFRIEADRIGVDTADRRAALEARLVERASTIADSRVARHYKTFFYRRVFGALRKDRWKKRAVPAPEPTRRPAPLARRREEALLAIALHHPWIAIERMEEFVSHDLAPDLAALRSALVAALQRTDDPDAIRDMLREQGVGDRVWKLLEDASQQPWPFAHPDASNETILAGWDDLMTGFAEEIERRERAAALHEGTEDAWRRAALAHLPQDDR